jgi:flagella basal body P-ring formation protein FlgA
MSALLVLALFAAAPGIADDVEVAVLAHPVARGERIDAGDFSNEQRTSVAARGALTADAAGGMEAARNLSAGAIVRAGDVVRPRLVRRGQPVTIRIVSGTLVITAAGRALGDASAGEPVRIVADATSRTLEGVVEGAGVVRIITP